MPQCSPLSGQVLPLCHRVSSPKECGLATFWLLIVCVKSMSGAHVLCFEELGHKLYLFLKSNPSIEPSENYIQLSNLNQS